MNTTASNPSRATVDDATQQLTHLLGDFLFKSDVPVLTHSKTGNTCFLTTKEFELLRALLTGPKRKHDIIDRIWTRRGVVVSDDSYYQLVRQLRKRLECAGFQREVIRTIPGFGLTIGVPIYALDSTGAPPAAAIDGVRGPVAPGDDPPTAEHAASGGARAAVPARAEARVDARPDVR
ncbi:winged helix-turn-helix domain-containing protein [Chitinasiproducens palmae]|uniref:DNA-binding winged helix-turn-helix (WHTH) domain-containing protein n=1 Tax=Chitinasiproducens palmae TaxID=1770053 RepID=A0A1H2PJ39_9BURK|nr:helix-turn-helix domain-containing protein [Chitinasiproducens palmae]SDV46300.1 DNA-binding winged helix-turn-helix (wHTH) domain-containing protein [Chitinasiproducens palmae]